MSKLLYIKDKIENNLVKCESHIRNLQLTLNVSNIPLPKIEKEISYELGKVSNMKEILRLISKVLEGDDKNKWLKKSYQVGMKRL